MAEGSPRGVGGPEIAVFQPTHAGLKMVASSLHTRTCMCGAPLKKVGFQLGGGGRFSGILANNSLEYAFI